MANLRGYINDSVTEIQLDDTTTLPVNGGVVEIEDELVRYTFATDKAILGCERGYNDTDPVEHNDGTLVSVQATVKPLYSLQEYSGSGAPTDHLTGVGFAFKGTRYTDMDSAIMYMNNGDETDPVWTPFAEGEAGGASGPEGAVQLSDGAGHFVNDAGLTFDGTFLIADNIQTTEIHNDDGGLLLQSGDGDISLNSVSGGEVSIHTNGDTFVWHFGEDGNIVVPDGSTIGNGSSGLTLTSGSGGGLFLAPTGAIEMTPGVGNQNVDIFATNVTLNNTGPGTILELRASNSSFLEFSNDDGSSQYGTIKAGDDTSGNLIVEANTGVLQLTSDTAVINMTAGGNSASWDGTNFDVVSATDARLRLYGTVPTVRFHNSDGDIVANIEYFNDTLIMENTDLHVSINDLNDDGAASPCAILHLRSETKGFLPPSLNTTQRDAISDPSAGLMIFNTTTQKLNVFTSAWEVITSV